MDYKEVMKKYEMATDVGIDDARFDIQQPAWVKAEIACSALAGLAILISGARHPVAVCVLGYMLGNCVGALGTLMATKAWRARMSLIRAQVNYMAACRAREYVIEYGQEVRRLLEEAKKDTQ